jgi:SARP family transcriptional regulator, regulator of embCAB operon
MTAHRWREVGVALAAGATRFYLTGRVALEGSRHVDQLELHGTQGRLTLVYLVVHRHRPVTVDELAGAVWGDELPRTWEPSLRAIVSKVRRTLSTVAADVAIASDGGCYQLLARDAWVDVEAAVNAVDRAEGAIRRGDDRRAWSEATVAAGIAQRPVLPGADLPWIVDLRRLAHTTHVRALEILTQVYLARSETTLAITVAQQLLDLEPYRESAYRSIMRAHLAAGERADAVRAYEQLRHRLAEDLGVDPAPSSRAVHREALGHGGS